MFRNTVQVFKNSHTEGGVRAQLHRNLPAFTHPVACRDPHYQMSAKRVPDVWIGTSEGVNPQALPRFV